VRLIFAGTPDVAAVSLRALLDSRHDVVAVLTRPDAPSGRGRSVTASPVATLARDQGIPVLQPTTLRDPAVQAELAALEPECAPVVAYGLLVPEPVLAIPTHGWVNLHFSLLPAWRGAAPVQHAIWRGDDITGATTFRLDPGMDTGPVYGTLTETIATDDTAGTLLARLAEAGSGLLVATLDAIEAGTASPVAQVGDPTLAPKLSVDDARVRWSDPAVGVDRQVRACTPSPGAWTTVRGERLGLGPVTPMPEVPPLPAGRLQVGKREVLVGTATVPVCLGEVRPAGKRAMPAADWARGTRLTDEDALT
jgi:methionyl-tRNA formyltransferase